MQLHDPILPRRSQRLVAGGDAYPYKVVGRASGLHEYSTALGERNCQPNLQITGIQQTSTLGLGLITWGFEMLADVLFGGGISNPISVDIFEVLKKFFL